MSYGLLGYSKVQQAIKEKHNDDLKRAREELAMEWEQKKIDWNRRKREKEDRFNQSRPADEHPIVRCIAWIYFCMHDEEYGSEWAEFRKSQRIAAIQARAIKNQERKEEEKKREEEKKKKREDDIERHKDQSLAEIRTRAIRDGDKREEEEKKKREEEKNKK